jgi:hypothetical protein
MTIRNAGPEQIDLATPAAVLLDRVLEAGDALIGDAENFEEVDQEGLCLAVFIAGIRPVPGKGGGAGFDFVPGERHGFKCSCFVPCYTIFPARGYRNISLPESIRRCLVVDAQVVDSLEHVALAELFGQAGAPEFFQHVGARLAQHQARFVAFAVIEQIR